jgi:hypothetical protein
VLVVEIMIFMDAEIPIALDTVTGIFYKVRQSLQSIDGAVERLVRAPLSRRHTTQMQSPID